MSDKFTRQILRTATGQICQNIGYTSTMASALDVMQDVLYRIITELGRDLKLATEHCNRRRPHLTDVVWTLQHCTIDFKAFHDYLTNVEPIPFVHDVPMYPVRKPEDPEYWKPKDSDEYIICGGQQAIKSKEEEEEQEVEKINIKNELNEIEENHVIKIKIEENNHAVTGGGDLEVDAIENDAKNMEEFPNENIEKLNKNILTNNIKQEKNIVSKGRTSDSLIPSIIFKYLNLDVPPPPTPPAAPSPEPPPAEIISIPPSSKRMDTTTTTEFDNANEILDIIAKNPEQQQKQKPMQQKVKKQKKNKVLDEIIGEIPIIDNNGMTTTTSINKDEKTEKKKKLLKKELKQQQFNQQQNDIILLEQQNATITHEEEKHQKKQEKLRQKQLKQQQKEYSRLQKKIFDENVQQLQLNRQHELDMHFYDKQQHQQTHKQKMKSSDIVDVETTAAAIITATTTTTNNILGTEMIKRSKLEKEYDYYNSNNDNSNYILQQQRKFQVNLPHLPTGTTITPAPPISKSNQITTNDTVLSTTSTTKTGKKRGRKPGSKNQTKTLPPPHMMFSSLLDSGMVKALNERQYAQPSSLEQHFMSNNLQRQTPFILNQQQAKVYGQQQKQPTNIDGNSSGAMDLTTTNYLQQQQTLPFMNYPANLYPYAATARPGLIPAGGAANPLYYSQKQQFPSILPTSTATMDFKPFMQQQENIENYIQQQQQQPQQLASTTTTTIKSGGGGSGNDINKYICNIPPLISEHLKIAAIMPKNQQHLQEQQQQQLKNNFTPSETIDLLSDDSNDQSQQQQQPLLANLMITKNSNIQKQQQQQLYALQSNSNIIDINNRKANKKPYQQQQQQQDILMPSSAPLQQQTIPPIVSKLAGGADLIPLTNTGMAYSSQNIPHTSLTGGCQLSIGGGTVPSTVELLGDITITKTTHATATATAATAVAASSITPTIITTTTITNNNEQSLYNDEQLIMNDTNNIKKNKHSKKDKKLKKIKEGKINKKQKKEKKDKDKKHKFEKILKQIQHQQLQPLHDILDEQHKQHQHEERDLLKKQKREKKKEKYRRFAENLSNLNTTTDATASVLNASGPDVGPPAAAGLIPKLTLKLAGKNSPITTMTSKEQQTGTGGTPIATNSLKNVEQQLSREYSPELAKFSPLVTRPPKQKSSSVTTSPPQPLVVVPPPPPSSWTSGETFPASSVLLPSQLFSCNDPILPTAPPKSKDNVVAIEKTSTSSIVPNMDFNNIKPHSYVDEEGHMIWICPACGKVDDGSPMIGCDGCDAWYHWACVGITVAPKQNEDWFCRVCLMLKMGSNTGSSVTNVGDLNNKKRKRNKKK